MCTFTIKNLNSGAIIADKAKKADTFFKRLKGLMFRKGLEKGEALIIEPCKSIHMFFMYFPVDAIFLDENNRVVKVYENLRPPSITGIIKNASRVVEVAEGVVKNTNTRFGDLLEIIKN